MSSPEERKAKRKAKAAAEKAERMRPIRCKVCGGTMQGEFDHFNGCR